MYVPSKGRYDNNLTAKMFARDRVPFTLVVEPAEQDHYAAVWGDKATIEVLPADGFGLMAARNWIRDHAEAAGADRHWQFDDNIRGMLRPYKGKRLPIEAGAALTPAEDFVDRYTNVALAGFQYYTFHPDTCVYPPFVHNVHVYSATLVNHAMPYRWRRAYNDDTDIVLQALVGGWATILFNAFLIDKLRTMTMAGGNTTDLYDPLEDGRLKMARSLERDWPGVVTTKRRFERPQHVVKGEWSWFDTPLIRRPDLVLPEGNDEYGMQLREVKPIKSDRVRSIVAQHKEATSG